MKKFLVSVLAIAGLVACHNEEIVSVQKGNPIAFDSFVENATRVGYNSSNPLEEFDVWAYMGNTRILTQERVYGGPDYRYDNTQYWIPGQPYFFAALAPCDAVTVADGNVTNEGLGEITFTNTDGTQDLIYATYSVTADGSQDAVELQFNHLLSKVKFSFKNEFDNANYTFTVSNIKMTAPESASINLTADEYTWDSHAGNITLEFGATQTEHASVRNKFSSDDLLTIPAGVGQVYNVTFDVNLYVAGTFARTYNKEAKISGIEFEAGKGYSLTATINADTFNLEDIDFDATVENWDDTSAPAYEPYKVEVNGVDFDNLADACDAAMNSGYPVKFFQHVVIDADTTITVPAGKTLELELNGYTLTGVTNETSSNRNMFDVRGTMTVNGAPISRASAAVNGTISVKHIGTDMGWGASTNVFNVTAGGVLNLENVTAKNLGGSAMAFVAHLNNWGEVTLNVNNSTLESTYIAVRVFNSGNDMNNVTIANTELKGKYCFWVHNYKAAGDNAGTDATLNLNIYNPGQNNTFTYTSKAPVLFGFANPINVDQYGISKKVSDDGSIVEMGSVIDNGIIYRGTVGTEENQTIKKVVVGEGITTLYDRTFRRFYALETVELPSTLTHIGVDGSGVFQSCNNLKNVVLPENLVHLGKGSFQECSSLTSINIPQGVTRIEENALRATGLVSVEFHEGVIYFGSQAFRDCKQLKSVVIKAPQFTVEANAFGIMSGTPGTIIYVANDEMKAYLESTLMYGSQFRVVVMGTDNNVASNDTELKTVLENAQSGATVYVAAGQYNALPDVKDGVIVEAAGAVFNGVSHVRGNGATVKGATFINNFTGDNDNCLTGALNNTTFENCVFESYSALRWCNATGDIVFTNCKFGTEQSWRGVHFDTGNNTTMTFNNCDLYGFQAIGSTVEKVIFNKCNFFKGRSTNVVNMYDSVYEYNNCKFVAGYYCDCAANGVTATFKGCSYVDNSNIINIVRFDKDPATCTITFDGKKYVSQGLLCNESTNTYTVYSGAGFKYMATSVLNDGTKNVTIELANDIDLAGIEWPAVRTNAAFVLDGKGYAIKNLTTSAVESDGFDCTALFTSTRKATTIKNLVVDNATVTGNGRSNSHGAVLVATPWAALNIEGVTVKNSTVSNCDRSSVLVTYLYFQPATVKNCVVEGCTVNSIGTAGALLGVNNSKNFEATGNTVKGTTISSSEGSNKAGILIGTWQSTGTLTESGNVVENSKAINAGTETNNNIGRTL